MQWGAAPFEGKYATRWYIPSEHQTRIERCAVVLWHRSRHVMGFRQYPEIDLPNAQSLKMFSRKIRVAILVALTVCGATPTLIESQTARRTTRRVRRPSRNRPPVIPAVRYSTPRTSADLASTLGTLTARTRGGAWGVMVVSLTRGDTLYAYNPGEQMLPASTMKLLTSAIAFERFGPTYQFSTDALREGAVGPDGTLSGNLYLRGDGDPALSGKFLAGGPEAPMNRLADLVAQQGI